MRVGIGGTCAVGVLLLAGVLPDPAWGGGAAKRHDGFFLRMSPGIGHASTKLDDGFDELRFSDGIGGGDFAIGGIVAKNLALHGTLWGWTMGDPDFELNNQDGSINGSLTMSAIGMGVTYYVMPINLYFSGSLGFGQLELDVDPYGSGNTDSGLVFEFVIGKEWWVSRNWALGVAGALGAHSIDDDLVSENWNGSNIEVRFSATFN